MLTLVWSSMKVPVLVPNFHSFRSSKFVIGRLLFVLVVHVGLFVFAFFTKSRFRLKFSKVTEIRTQICLQISYIVLTLQGCRSSCVSSSRRRLRIKLAHQTPRASFIQAGSRTNFPTVQLNKSKLNQTRRLTHNVARSCKKEY